MTRELRGPRRTWLLLPMLLVAWGSPLHAQGVAPVRAGTWELNGAFGYTYGIDEAAGKRSRVNGGATLSYALTKHILPYVEYSYFPGVARVQEGTEPNGTRYVSRYDIPITDFHGGVHLRFTPAESRFVPYVAVGVGMLRSHGTNYIYEAQGSNPLEFPLPSQNSAAVNFGGGLRYYVGQYWGVRGEAKAYKPTGDVPLDRVFAKLQFGVFWQFGGK